MQNPTSICATITNHVKLVFQLHLHTIAQTRKKTSQNRFLPGDAVFLIWPPVIQYTLTEDNGCSHRVVGFHGALYADRLQFKLAKGLLILTLCNARYLEGKRLGNCSCSRDA